jgi:hypothetical protein
MPSATISVMMRVVCRVCSAKPYASWSALMMDEEQFWSLIAEARTLATRAPLPQNADFLALHIAELHQLLRQLSPDDLTSYQRHFRTYLHLAYRWDLWGVAYWLGGGCSDDGFWDFRSCLISLGKEHYFQVLHDSDSLADLVGRPDVPYMQSEGFQYVATDVYREQTGQDSIPEPEEEQLWPDEPAGERFDFEDEEVMRQRFPRLVAKYPEMGD